MTLRVAIKDVATRRPMVRKVLWSNTDQVWERATLYLLRELEDLPQAAR